MQSDAQREAVKRYQARFARLQVRLPMEEAEAVRARAEALGLSLSAYVRQLIRADMRKGGGI